MKNILFLFLLLSFSAVSQDVLNKKNGETINAKVLEVNPDNVKYKKTDNQDGPTYTIDKKELAGITYANGEEDIFKIESKGDKKMFIWAPSMKKVELPMLSKSAKIQIIDNRKTSPAKSKVEFSGKELVDLLAEILKNPKTEGVHIVEAGSASPDVKISIEAYDAVFYPGAWHTQTRYFVTVYKGGKPAIKEIESLKGAFNTFGAGTARARLTKSFEEATTQLITFLNEKL
ncbi:hypothetical protein [Dyadobacter sp. OTU695]|uniref:hypothetical protein n=1 Tax=Dyadobacter sp. OTU695 TaxID=3043860 RepID=UPI00313CB44A